MSLLSFKWTWKRKGKTFATIEQRAKQVAPLMRLWASVLKDEAKQQFADRAPPLAASTQYKRAHTGTGAITAAAQVRKPYAEALDEKLRKKGDGVARDALRAVLRGDFRKGQSKNKTVDRLRRRLATAQAAKAAGMKIATGKRADSHTRGGKMGRAFKGSTKGTKALVENLVKFSKVHDTGGTVGNNAVLPAWNFTEITAAVRAKLASIATHFWLGGK